MMRKILLIVLMFVVIATEAEAYSLHKAKYFAEALRSHRNMSGMWLVTDNDVQHIATTSERDDKYAISYEFFYKKNDDIFIARGQRRIGEARTVFYATYDPKTKLLAFSDAGDFIERIAEIVKKEKMVNHDDVDADIRAMRIRAMAGKVPFALDIKKENAEQFIKLFTRGGSISVADEIALKALDMHPDELVEMSDRELPWSYGLASHYTLALYQVKDDFHNSVLELKSYTENLNCIEETKRVLQNLKAEKIEDCIKLYETTNKLIRAIGADELMTNLSRYLPVHKQVSRWFSEAGTKKVGAFLSKMLAGLPLEAEAKNIQDAHYGLMMKLREPDSLKVLTEKVKKPAYLE